MQLTPEQLFRAKSWGHSGESECLHPILEELAVQTTECPATIMDETNEDRLEIGDKEGG